MEAGADLLHLNTEEGVDAKAARRPGDGSCKISAAMVVAKCQLHFRILWFSG